MPMGKYKKSDEQRRKMSETRKLMYQNGYISPAKGKHWRLSDETRKRMSMAQSKRPGNLQGLSEEEKEKRLSELNARRNKERRLLCLVRYGGNPPKCKCCDEEIIGFLAIDHIKGDGNKHRKEMGVGKSIYPWLIRNEFPDGFQVLCHNCNLAKAFYGICPHNVV